jgi:hypothetical protein
VSGRGHLVGVVNPCGTELTVLKEAVQMPETTAKRAAAARKAAASRRGSAAKKPAPTPRRRTGEATELPDEVLRAVESGQRAAIEAVRKFVDKVDESLPLHGEGASKRQEVVDAAMEMAERLVHTQYDFLRKVVDSAGMAVTRRNDGK